MRSRRRVGGRVGSLTRKRGREDGESGEDSEGGADEHIESKVTEEGEKDSGGYVK